ncbi:MAG TPA: DHH family phosphoesterase, partial [bacterium]|nr:DHH family phosphoesterase [bacterium]
MIQGKEWQPVRDFIRDKHRIAVTTHIHPDGDAIGSQMAMAHYLRQIGKEVVLLNCDVTPEYFHFLDPGKEIGLYSPQLHETVISGLDGCLVVDISDWGRLRALGEALQRYRIPLACIDHHIPAEQ